MGEELFDDTLTETEHKHVTRETVLRYSLVISIALFVLNILLYLWYVEESIVEFENLPDYKQFALARLLIYPIVALAFAGLGQLINKGRSNSIKVKFWFIMATLLVIELALILLSNYLYS